ncbi:hypothetical protein C8Q79DRAFT_929390 [Trametes meyenii]|nr:hypothetical protein C8Q79DRAFT_929390 [Trametes meyenii]
MYRLCRLSLVDLNPYNHFLTTPRIVSITSTALCLQELELRSLPLKWDDPVFCSTMLTSLIVACRYHRNTSHLTTPNVGTFKQLLSALHTAAPSLEVLELRDSIPFPSVTTVAGDSLPMLSVVKLLSLCTLHLTGEANCCASLINHLNIPSTTQIHLVGYSNPGHTMDLTLACCTLNTHISHGPPILAVCFLWEHVGSMITMSCWPFANTTGKAQFCLELHGGSSHTTLTDITESVGTFFSDVQDLSVLGLVHIRWSAFLTQFVSVRTLQLDMHPWDKFFSSLMEVSTLQDGESYVHLLGLPLLKLSDLYSRVPKDDVDVELVDEFLERLWVRKKCCILVSELHLNGCRHITAKDIRRLKKHVASVM